MSGTRDRLSQCQCPGTLCLQGKEGRRAKRKKERSVFSGFPTFCLGLWRSPAALQWDGPEQGVMPRQCWVLLYATPRSRFPAQRPREGRLPEQRVY